MVQFYSFVFIFVLAPLFAQILAFQQNDYNLTSERLEVPEYNKAFIIAKSHNFKYNRTHTGLNATFNIKQPLVNLKIEIQAYRFASNEYRLFPINFKVDVCDVLKNNDFGMRNIFECGNFTGCPIAKGQYIICNWAPDESKFPPHVPSGRYMIDLKFVQGPTQILLVQWYMKVEKRFFYQ